MFILKESPKIVQLVFYQKVEEKDRRFSRWPDLGFRVFARRWPFTLGIRDFGMGIQFCWNEERCSRCLTFCGLLREVFGRIIGCWNNCLHVLVSGFSNVEHFDICIFRRVFGFHQVLIVFKLLYLTEFNFHKATFI